MHKSLTALMVVICLMAMTGIATAETQINIATVTNPSLVHTKAAVWFKECVEKALPGKYVVNVHHSAALGSETQVLQQIQLGTTQMSVCTTGPIEAFVPEIKALEMPFLLPSCEMAEKVLDGAIEKGTGQKIRAIRFHRHCLSG